MRNREGVSRGFGFVTYRERQSEEACLQFSRHTVAGKDCEVKSAVPAAMREQNERTGGIKEPPMVLPNENQVFEGPRSQTILFIGGMEKKTSKEDLRTYFEQYGDVKDCMSMAGRGFGYVEF